MLWDIIAAFTPPSSAMSLSNVCIIYPPTLHCLKRQLLVCYFRESFHAILRFHIATTRGKKFNFVRYYLGYESLIPVLIFIGAVLPFALYGYLLTLGKILLCQFCKFIP